VLWQPRRWRQPLLPRPAGSYNADTLIGVLGGQRATLLWDGLGAHRSRKMREFLATQRDWLVVERLPAYAPDLNPVEALWSTSRARSWPTWPAAPSAR